MSAPVDTADDTATWPAEEAAFLASATPELCARWQQFKEHKTKPLHIPDAIACFNQVKKVLPALYEKAKQVRVRRNVDVCAMLWLSEPRTACYGAAFQGTQEQAAARSSCHCLLQAGGKGAASPAREGQAGEYLAEFCSVCCIVLSPCCSCMTPYTACFDIEDGRGSPLG